MKRISFMSMMAAAIFALASFTAYAQGDAKKPASKPKTEKKASKPKKKVKIKAKTVDPKGTSMNIKQDKTASDVMNAGSDCSYTCSAKVNNYSYYTVDIYLDGNYAGTVAPRSYLTVTTCNGYTTFYGRSAGKTKEWNSTGDCNFSVNWNLYD